MRRLLLIIGLATTLLAGSGCRGLFHKHEEHIVVATTPDEPLQYIPSAEAVEKLQKVEHQLAKGHWAKAEELLNEILALEPQCGIAHNQLGVLYLRRCDLYRAAIEFDNAISLLPSDPEPQYNLGMTLERAMRYPQAVIHYETAFSLSPTNPAILGSLIRARLIVDEADPEVKFLLEDLLMIETRPDWRAWAEEELALIQPLTHDPRPQLTAPSTKDAPKETLLEPPPLRPPSAVPPPPAPGEIFPWAEPAKD